MTAYYLIIEKKKANVKWLVFISFLFVSGTLNLVFNANFNELAWIDYRNYPGGPLAYIEDQEAIPINTAGNTFGIVTYTLTQLVLVRDSCVQTACGADFVS